MIKTIKYPYSELKKHHSHYLKCVSVFFQSMYDAWFYVGVDESSINIKIHEVNPFKMYNPMNFDPSYKARSRDSDYYFVCKHDMFNNFYNYLPDIVPYLEVELFVAHDIIIGNGDLELNNVRHDGCFEKFNFRELYYMEETRNHFSNTAWEIPETQFDF